MMKEVLLARREEQVHLHGVFRLPRAGAGHELEGSMHLFADIRELLSLAGFRLTDLALLVIGQTGEIRTVMELRRAMSRFAWSEDTVVLSTMNLEPESLEPLLVGVQAIKSGAAELVVALWIDHTASSNAASRTCVILSSHRYAIQASRPGGGTLGAICIAGWQASKLDEAIFQGTVRWLSLSSSNAVRPPPLLVRSAACVDVQLLAERLRIGVDEIHIYESVHDLLQAAMGRENGRSGWLLCDASNEGQVIVIHALSPEDSVVR